MYYSYEKKTDIWTTYELLQPDYEQMPEDSARITELCTIDGITYVYVPDSITLPKQPEQVQVTLTEVILDPSLITKIKKSSPHVKLMKKRKEQDENVRLTKQDELTLSFLLEFMEAPAECLAYIVKCREWEAVHAEVEAS